MTAPDTISQRPSPFWRAVGALLKALVRLTLVVLVGLLVGVGIYYGVQWTYYTMVLPIQQNSQDIATLTQRLDGVTEQTQDQTAALQGRVADLEGEITVLKETVAVQEQALGTLTAQLDALSPTIDELQATVTAQNADLDRLETALKRADRDLSAQNDRLSNQEAALQALEKDINALEEDLNAQLGTVAKDLTGLNLEQSDLAVRFIFLQTAQDLLRARLFLLEDNIGAAQDAVTLAITHVERAAAISPDLVVETTDLVSRMQTLKTLIARRSFRATPTLEVLWADMVALALPTTPTSLPELTPTTEVSAPLTATVTITPTTSVTTTATVTITLTPTPKP